MRHRRSDVASDEAARIMELLRLMSDGGRCVDCFQTVAPAGTADVGEASARWPIFVPVVAERGDLRLVP